MDLGLSGKVAFVTGASRGIGQSIAEALAQEGAKLVLVARSAAELTALGERLPTESLVFAADLRESEAPGRAVEAAVARFGALDIVVNCAGATVRGDFLELTDAQWEDGFALKFYGAMRVCRAAWPHLKSAGGVIVNIVGIGGRTGTAEFAIGGAVNAALLNLTKVLADRGMSDGVRVNAVNPGYIATGRLKTRIARHAAEKGIGVAEAEADLPKALGIPRFGEPGEIARAVAFLASPVAGYCQGAILDIDGGMTRTL